MIGNLFMCLGKYLKFKYDRAVGGRWWHRRTLGSPHPADHLDSTHTCLNNPENCQKTSRMDSPEPSIDKKPREEGTLPKWITEGKAS